VPRDRKREAEIRSKVREARGDGVDRVVKARGIRVSLHRSGRVTRGVARVDQDPGRWQFLQLPDTYVVEPATADLHALLAEGLADWALDPEFGLWLG